MQSMYFDSVLLILNDTWQYAIFEIAIFGILLIQMWHFLPSCFDDTEFCYWCLSVSVSVRT